MAKTKLKSLTPEQEALIPVIREKWRAIVFSKGLINRSKAKEAVKVAYSVIRKKEPEIIFFDSPYAALNSPILNRKGRFLANLFDFELKWKLEQQLMSHKARQFQYLAYQLYSNPK
ncbi:hypothetical protein NDI37_06340 [Funiculus sociatus GB2-A5]|uniref:Uncharacterized protein n=1 Tax=Funiculus sociatus GB2-A5 TaxID=2933946 RepID=A0ABV0JN32_9CYAN|nr:MULTISPECIES: hypothetical protein [unclassified Trichocoleus]MBD1906273.1 hypothetical protein [Trichocoleus sp. FACHB-832]MBD2061438.1 hypothetical protein [Trichocoleus sp. FACHB-6]